MKKCKHLWIESFNTYTHKHLLTNELSGMETTSQLELNTVLGNCMKMSYVNKEFTSSVWETESHDNLLLYCNSWWQPNIGFAGMWNL